MLRIPSPLEVAGKLIRWLNGSPERQRIALAAVYFFPAVMVVSVLLHPKDVYEERNRYLDVVVSACLQEQGLKLSDIGKSSDERHEWLDNCMILLTSKKNAAG